MKVFVLNLLSICLVSAAFAKGGDHIREVAPVTALFYDARDGNEEPLVHAYLNQEIDYFLDAEAPRNTVVRDIYMLREAGRLVNRGDYVGAENAIRGLKKFSDEKTYLMGTLEAGKGRYTQAAEYFRRIIDNRTDVSKNLASLAFLGAARIFHEVGDYKAAIYHYTQVKQLEPQFFQSVFEKSWSLYQMGDMNGALGSTVSFFSPFFDKSFYPEAFVLRSAAFFQLCYFDRASITIEKLKRDYEPLRTHISQLVSRDPQSWLFDERTLKSVNPRLVGSMMADRDFRSATRTYLALKNEVTKLRGTDAQLANRLITFVKQKLSQEARRVLAQADKVLRDVLAQADIIQIEILQSGANLLMGQTPEHSVPVKNIDINEVDFDELVQFWPFKGEWWIDELGSYYYGLKSNCEP